MTNPTAGYSYNICRYRGDTDRHPLKRSTWRNIFDPRIYIAGELGIGLNSCSNCLGNCYIEDESAYGTFHVGLGRNIALGGVQNAKGHFDLVMPGTRYFYR